MTSKNTILLLLAAGTGWLTLTSNNAGPGISGQGDRSSTGCGGAGCHSTSTTVQMTHQLSSGGVPVTNNQYTPGATYTVTLVAGNTPTTPSFTHFGFQTTARRSNGSNAGTLSTSTANTHTYTGGGRTGVEHGPKIAATINLYQVSFQWTAPAAGTGTVTFNSAVNLVNNDNNVTGDLSNTGTTQFNEGPVSVQDVAQETLLAISPNPAKDRIRIDTREWRAGEYSIVIFSSTGSVVMKHALRHSGAEAVDLKLPDLSTGLYAVRVQSAGMVQASPLFIR